jgi:dynein heavy chain
MPAYDAYGSQMPIELLRQYVDYKGIYDRTERFWKSIADTTLICSAAPPEGGRKVLSKRFTRHFHMICLPPTAEDSLQQIFYSIMDGFFKDFRKDIQMVTKPIVDCTMNIFNNITKELRPTPSKSHYTFNLRDISKVFQGMCMADPSKF